MGGRSLPKRIRVSVGSAIVLGLIKGRLDAEPTTVYLLTYRHEKCSANCGFCPQAKIRFDSIYDAVRYYKSVDEWDWWNVIRFK